MRGGFRVGKVWTGSPDEIWNTVSDCAGVEKRDFDAYFLGQSSACALEVTQVWQYATPVGLDVLRSWFQKFVVPQSWRYVTPEEYSLFQGLER